MTATADMILERRRLRRRLTLWRILAIGAVLVAVLAMLPGNLGRGDHIARVSIDGVIRGDRERDEMLGKLAESKKVKAVIVRINSPGGTVVGSEALHLQLRAIAEKKPVVAVMTEMAASGGYITALAAEYIVASGNTLTGSIGVVSEAPNIAGLMEMLGVSVTRVKSTPLKAEPSLTQTPPPEALRAQEELILDMYDWFRGLVKDRRGLDGNALDIASDGRAFTGRQALDMGLVDVLGDEQTAIDWLAEKHDLDPEMDVVEKLWGDKAKPWPISAMVGTSDAMELLEGLYSDTPRLYALIQ